MPTLFEYLDSINVSKEVLMVDDQSEKDYAPYMVNRGLAQNVDTILFAAEMNRSPLLDKELQYKFLLGVVTSKKRYGKWTKKEEIDPDVPLIAAAYGISYDRAVEYLALLTEEQKQQIREELDQGGVKKKGKKT